MMKNNTRIKDDIFLITWGRDIEINLTHPDKTSEEFKQDFAFLLNTTLNDYIRFKDFNIPFGREGGYSELEHMRYLVRLLENLFGYVPIRRSTTVNFGAKNIEGKKITCELYTPSNKKLMKQKLND